jgi:hypothetical protein
MNALTVAVIDPIRSLVGRLLPTPLSFQRRLALICFSLLFLYKTRAFGYGRNDKGDLQIRILYNLIFIRIKHRLRDKITRRQKERERRIAIVKSQFSHTEVGPELVCTTDCV